MYTEIYDTESDKNETESICISNSFERYCKTFCNLISIFRFSLLSEMASSIEGFRVLIIGGGEKSTLVPDTRD